MREGRKDPGYAILALVAVLWLAVLLIHAPLETRPVGVLEVTFSLLVTAALVAGVRGELGRRRESQDEDSRVIRNAARAILAALPVGAWSAFLFADTGYLEPLPLEAGTIGGALLIAAAVGGGLTSGWQWWTLLVLPAAAVGLIRISDDLFDSAGDLTSYHPAVYYCLLLLPLAIGVGAFASRWIPHAVGVGLAVMVLPVVGVAWAGFRHARPIDRRPKSPLLIKIPVPPARPAYRGLAIGDTKATMLALFGQPDEVRDSIYEYGADRVTLNGESQSVLNANGNHVWDGVEEIEIHNSSAETAAGVGVGDNLGQFRKRYPGEFCGIFHYQDGCEIDMGYAYVDFSGDPIESIDMVASSTQGRGG